MGHGSLGGPSGIVRTAKRTTGQRTTTVEAGERSCEGMSW